MRDDSVDQYRGREAEWAALCSFDAVEYGLKTNVTEADADDLVGSAWDFVVDSCKEAGVPAPNRSVVLALVRVMLQAYNAASDE